jgi:hypothetical protein
MAWALLGVTVALAVLGPWFGVDSRESGGWPFRIGDRPRCRADPDKSPGPRPGGIDRGDAGPGGEMRLVGEPGGVGDLDRQPGRAGRAR